MEGAIQEIQRALARVGLGGLGGNVIENPDRGQDHGMSHGRLNMGGNLEDKSIEDEFEVDLGDMRHDNRGIEIVIPMITR